LKSDRGHSKAVAASPDHFPAEHPSIRLAPVAGIALSSGISRQLSSVKRKSHTAESQASGFPRSADGFASATG
jgi:hypothetical protein